MALPNINDMLSKKAAFGMQAPVDWVNLFQNPYDKQMSELTDWSPEELSLTQQYQDALDALSQSNNPANQKIAAGALDTAQKYYGGYGFGDTMLSENFNPALDALYGNGGEDQLGMTPLQNPPTVSESFSPEFTNDFLARQAQQAKAAGDLVRPAAQFDLSQVPQVSPKLLNESGYDPATLALMRGHATEDVANAGATELSQARRALGQAGLGESGAGAAFGADIGRRTGDANTAAQRDISIQNANVGLENQRSNMAVANQMALENASKLFSAMSQNTANQQAQGQAASAAATGMFSNLGNEFGQASLNRANQSAFTNQAAQQRTNELNFGANEDRWRAALQAITNFSNPSFPNAPAPGTSATGNALSNLGSSFLDTAISNYPWGKPAAKVPEVQV